MSVTSLIIILTEVNALSITVTNKIQQILLKQVFRSLLVTLLHDYRITGLTPNYRKANRDVR